MHLHCASIMHCNVLPRQAQVSYSEQWPEELQDLLLKRGPQAPEGQGILCSGHFDRLCAGPSLQSRHCLMMLRDMPNVL